MKKAAYLIASILAMRTCHAASIRDWSWQDVAMESAFGLAILADHQTSEHITSGNEGYHEAYGFLPEHMSQRTLNWACITAVGLHLGTTWVIPHGKYRSAFQTITLGYELSVINHNRQIGMSCSWHWH